MAHMKRNSDPLNELNRVLALLVASAAPRPALAQSCTGPLGAPVTCPTTSGGLEARHFPPLNLELQIAEGEVEGEVAGKIVPIPVPKPNPRLEELIALKPAYRVPPYPRRKPPLPTPIVLTTADHLAIFDQEWTHAFVDHFAKRFSEHYNMSAENLSIKGFTRAFIYKYKIAGWKGNIGIEAAVTEGADILRGNKEIDDWAVNLVGFCLMISQALLVEAFMHLPAVYVMTKMPFFGDAAERVARSSVEIVVYGYTEAIVMATIAFYAATDAIEAHREFRAQEDAMLEARRVKNFSLHGEASDICNKQTIAPGITIESCIGR